MNEELMEEQRRVIEEYKKIMEDKNEQLEEWCSKCCRLTEEVQFLKDKLIKYSGQCGN